VSRRSQILAVATHLPERVETNEQLARENPGWDMDYLCSKLGIRQRRVAAEDETALDLALAAGRKLLDRELVPPDQVDYLLYCTQSPQWYLPSTACVLQDRLGLPQRLGALDFNLGCSGYVYGLGLARALIADGQASHVLLITADTYTKYIHPNDRATRPLFGDGAAATLIGPAEDDEPGDIGPMQLRTDGRGYEHLIVPAGGMGLPRSPRTAEPRTGANGCTRSAENLYMDGPAIFTFAIACVPPLIAELLAAAGLTADDVDWYVYHQANQFMLDRLFERSGVPAEKAVLHFADIGNTVSSSIPIALEAYVRDGRIRPGQRLLLVGFGVGYSWAAGLITWGAGG